MNQLPTYPGDAFLWLGLAVPLCYLLGFVLQLLPFQNRGLRNGLALLSSGGAALFSLSLFFTQATTNGFSFPWVQIGDWFQLDVGILLNDTAGTMLVLVTCITFLVHLFSMEYMKNDPRLGRYWAFLALFAFSMCGIVLANNLFLVFVFWELVGFSSYLLIGFWFEKKAAAKASQKAFLLNRIGDLGFVLALLLLWDPQTVLRLDLPMTTEPSTLAGLCLALGALGKSAQFPLQVWLPDAMTGPTPVSSLLHAATMVAAGVYLLLRTIPFLNATVLDTLAVVGAVTAITAAIAAINQYDIKRVLAYSTVSQLGFMVMGIGVAAFDYAFFHLLTHAFFKCGLFLVAGAVIHQIHLAQHKSGTYFDAQDLRLMGGLPDRTLKIVYIVFAAALAGLPLFSGFLSKDGIVVGAWHFAETTGGWTWLVPVLAMIASGLTAYYIARHGLLIFGGKSRMDEATKTHLPKLSWKMAVPLVVLALFSLWVFWSPGNPLHGTLFPGILQADLPEISHSEAGILPLVLALLAAAGVGLAWWNWKRAGNLEPAQGLLARLSQHHFYMDQLYEKGIAPLVFRCAAWLGWGDKKIVDGAVNGVAAAVVREDGGWSLSKASAWWDKEVVDRIVNGVAGAVMAFGKRMRRLQTGDLQQYLIYTVLGLLVVLAALYYFVES